MAPPPYPADVYDGHLKCPACCRYGVLRHAYEETLWREYLDARGQVIAQLETWSEVTRYTYHCEECQAEFPHDAFTFPQEPS